MNWISKVTWVNVLQALGSAINWQRIPKVSWVIDNTRRLACAFLRFFRENEDFKAGVEEAFELLNTSPETSFVSDISNGWNSITYITPNVLKNFWYESQDMISWKIKHSDIIHEEDLERIRGEFKNVILQEEENFESQYRIYDAEGGIRRVRVILSIHHNSEMQPVKTVWHILDITETRELEIQLQQAYRELERVNRELAEQAILDALTWIWNRRYMDSRLQRQFDKVNLGKLDGVSFAIIDLDNFKTINDNFWHPVWDQALIYIANRLTELSSNNKDVEVFRYGGEEFWIIGKDMTPEEMKKLLEWILFKLKNEVSISKELVFKRWLPFSGGVAVYDASTKNITSPEVLVNHADAKLYLAKKMWRANIQI